GERLRLTRDAPGDDADSAELAERGGSRQADAVCGRPPDGRPGPAPEGLERGRAKRRRRLFLLSPDLAENRHDLADDERKRDEDRRERHPRQGEEDAVAGEPASGPIEEQEREADDDRRQRERQVDERVDEARSVEPVPDDRY